tara:strand:- start:2016 stop:2348 length:333 start_codon:yes stop_codon:yes gene_type:complete
MQKIKKYKILTNLIFFTLILLKILNVFLDRIDIILFLLWSLPLLVFWIFINKLHIKAYQWFCFILIIYFLSASLRVFGTVPYWIDIAELIFISFLFVQIMFGPKIISKMN